MFANPTLRGSDCIFDGEAEDQAFCIVHTCCIGPNQRVSILLADEGMILNCKINELGAGQGGLCNLGVICFYYQYEYCLLL